MTVCCHLVPDLLGLYIFLSFRLQALIVIGVLSRLWAPESQGGVFPQWVWPFPLGSWILPCIGGMFWQEQVFLLFIDVIFLTQDCFQTTCVAADDFILKWLLLHIRKGLESRRDVISVRFSHVSYSAPTHSCEPWQKPGEQN